VEEDFAANRQKFLAEQGYKYSIQHWETEELQQGRIGDGRGVKAASR
jgi:DNA excision repair protein ERCC-3